MKAADASIEIVRLVKECWSLEPMQQINIAAKTIVKGIGTSIRVG